jgi:hypothetical protein
MKANCLLSSGVSMKPANAPPGEGQSVFWFSPRQLARPVGATSQVRIEHQWADLALTLW